MCACERARARTEPSRAGTASLLRWTNSFWPFPLTTFDRPVFYRFVGPVALRRRDRAAIRSDENIGQIDENLGQIEHENDGQVDENKGRIDHENDGQIDENKGRIEHENDRFMVKNESK